MAEELNRMCHICRTSPVIGKEHLPPKSVAHEGKVKISFIDGTNMGNGIQHQELLSKMDSGSLLFVRGVITLELALALVMPMLISSRKCVALLV